MKFVLDCSITMAWCFEDQATPAADAILASLLQGYSAVVPALWALEVSNVLLLAERKKRIQLFQANNFKSALNALPITFDPTSMAKAFDTIFPLARELKLTIYDACYLELAIREAIPIATLDKELIKAAQKVNVALFTSR